MAKKDTLEPNVVLRNFNINQAVSPELHSDLKTLSGRERSERLRMLATIGLLFMRDGIGGNGRFSNHSTTPPEKQKYADAEKEAEENKAEALKKKMRNDLMLKLKGSI